MHSNKQEDIQRTHSANFRIKPNPFSNGEDFSPSREKIFQSCIELVKNYDAAALNVEKISKINCKSRMYESCDFIDQAVI